MQVAKEVIDQIGKGAPPPEDTLFVLQPEQSNTDNPQFMSIETSVGDCRLWAEILRNLAKDLSKQSTVQIPESLLANIDTQPQSQGDDPTTPSTANPRHGEGIAAFSCGHAFALSHFLSKVLMDFVERVQDFPISIPHTLKHLQLHYKQGSFYPSACPYCVFQYLRKLQLQECPHVPIRPWNPQL